MLAGVDGDKSQEAVPGHAHRWLQAHNHKPGHGAQDLNQRQHCNDVSQHIRIGALTQRAAQPTKNREMHPASRLLVLGGVKPS